MPSHPRVSVITASYNSGAVLASTIESVLAQGYDPLEYVIIDGGSRDGSVEIIRRYEARLASWVSESDEGIGDAFNKGIRASTGEIIGILNAGDRYADGAVAAAVEALEESPGDDFVYSDLWYVDAQGARLFLAKGDRHYEKTISYTMPAVNHPTVFMRRRVYEACGLYDPSYRIAMDYEFLLRISRQGRRGRYIGRPLAMMTIGGVSDKSFFAGYREVCRASIAHGYSPFKARVRLYLKGLRGCLRMALEALRLDALVLRLRRIFFDVR